MKKKILINKIYLYKYLFDLVYIVKQILFMFFIKKHYKAALIMVIYFSALFKARRTNKLVEYISPFVFVMQ